MSSTPHLNGSCHHGAAPLDWPRLVQEHSPWLRKVVTARVGDRDAVDDVMQNVSVAALHSDGRPSDAGRAAAWLYRVAVRQCLLLRRTAGRRRKLTTLVRQHVAVVQLDVPQPYEWLLHVEQRDAVQRALARLGDIDRELLILKHTECWTYQQLSDRLGVSIHAIEHRLMAARKRLRQALQAELPGEALDR